MWLISVGRPAVAAVVRWSGDLTTQKCLIDNYQQEMLDQLVFECQRSSIGLNITINYKSVKYGIFQENYQHKYAASTSRLFARPCAVVMKEKSIPSETVMRQIIIDLGEAEDTAHEIKKIPIEPLKF